MNKKNPGGYRGLITFRFFGSVWFSLDLDI